MPAAWILAARPKTLPAAAAPVLIGTAAAWKDGHLQPAAAGLCLAFALLVQIGTNFANDYYDFVKGADTAERKGPTRAVAAGLIAPRTMRAAAFATFAAAFAAGLGLVPFGGWPLLAVGIASVLSGLAYTGGPYPLGYNGLGDVFVLFFFGLVAVGGTYFVQAETLPGWVLLLGLAPGALSTNLLAVNNYRDAETDTKAGKRTLAVRFGTGFALAEYAVLGLLAHAVPVVLAVSGGGWWLALPLATLPWSLSLTWKLSRSTDGPSCNRVLAGTAGLLMLNSALLAAALALGR